MGGTPEMMQQFETVRETVKQTSHWWVPIAAACVTALGAIVAVILKRRK